MHKRRTKPAEDTYDLDSILMPLCYCNVVLCVLRLKRLDTGRFTDVYFCSDCGVVHVEPPKWGDVKQAQDPANEPRGVGHEDKP